MDISAFKERYCVFLKRHWVALCAFVFLLPGVLSLRNPFIYAQDIYRLLIDYSYGFGARRLMGTLFCGLFPCQDETLVNHFATFYFYSGLLASGLFFLVLDNTVGKSKNPVLLGLLGIYLFCQYSFRTFFDPHFNELFILIFTLLFILSFLCNPQREGVVYYLETGCLLVACCLIHPLFLFTFFPCFVGLFAYDALKEGINVTKLAVYAALTVFLAGVCVTSMVFQHPLDVGRFFLDIQERIPWMRIGKSTEWLFHYQYAASFGENWMANMLPFWCRMLCAFALAVLAILPFSASMAFPFWLQWKQAKDKRERWKWGVLWAMPFMTLPAYAIGTDYARWTASLLFCQLVLLLVVEREEEGMMEQAWHRFLPFAKKHSVLFVLFVGLVLFLLVEPETTVYNATKFLRFWLGLPD